MGESGTREPKPAIQRLRRRKERHQQRSRAYRILFVAAAATIILVGIVLLPLPGPGWLIIAAGVAMLALEFDRAERLLERILDRLDDARTRAERAGPVQKAIAVTLVVLAAAGAVVAVLRWEIPLLPG